MAIPIINDWEKYYNNPHEGLGSSYERIILNHLLLRMLTQYKISTALETPSFGFTGISGINLVALAARGVAVSIEDNHAKRLQLIKDTWSKFGLPLSAKLNQDFSKLEYPDNGIDLGFNFSALWFVADLKQFLSEICRVCRKAVLICVPNQQGIGFKMQIKDYNPATYPDLHPENISLNSIIYLMRMNGWKLVEQDYIDCPPWPDIGMSKEMFIKGIFKPNSDSNTDIRNPLSILPYYQGLDNGFKAKMLRYGIVERFAPRWFKRYWAHHYYLLFVPRG